jgi:hypothetical protein
MPHAVRRAIAVALLALALVAVSTPLTAAAPPDPGRVVTYPGGISVHLGQEGRLAATSRGFRDFVHARLLHLWKQSGGKPGCRTAPTVIVRTWASAGYARVGEGVYAPCPGGGYDQIYIKRGGAWRAPVALGSQEIRPCSLQAWFDLPLVVADRTCYSDFGENLKYRTYELPADFSTGDYAARVLAASFQDETGLASSWARRPVVDKLRKLQDQGATTFEVVRCFDPDDTEYGALLGTAPRGCRLDVGYGDHTDSYVLRTFPAKFGRWETRTIRVLGESLRGAIPGQPGIASLVTPQRPQNAVLEPARVTSGGTPG